MAFRSSKQQDLSRDNIYDYFFLLREMGTAFIEIMLADYLERRTQKAVLA